MEALAGAMDNRAKKSPGGNLQRSRSRGQRSNGSVTSANKRMFNPKNAYPAGVGAGANATAPTDGPKKSLNKALKQKHK